VKKHQAVETIFSLMMDHLKVVMPREIGRKLECLPAEDLGATIITCARSAGAIGNLCALLCMLDLPEDVRHDALTRARQAIQYFNSLINQFHVDMNTKACLKVDLSKLPPPLCETASVRHDLN
jgi:hypothetical protein